MKLAAIYSVYNGLELLEGSIKQIESEVDEVIIVYQTTSNHGETSQLDFEGIKATFDFYEPKITYNPKFNERRKHLQGVKKAASLGCTHYILMATDHYYKTEEFRWAKDIIEEGDFSASATKMYTYVKNNLRLDPIEEYYCPFISKITPDIRFGTSYPVYVDPALAMTPNAPFRELSQEEIMMHHYSWVRKDIKSKINNAASKQNWEGKDMYKSYKKVKLGGNFDYYPDKTIIKAGNFFQIPNF